MITVEMPTSSLEAELEQLSLVSGPNSALYARGAADAIRWILLGRPRPSEGAFLLPPEGIRVH